MKKTLAEIVAEGHNDNSCPSQETQKRIAYLNSKKVPIEDLIFVLECAYKANWDGREGAPSREKVEKWLESKGCTKVLKQALQQLLRPVREQRNKKSNVLPRITTVANNLKKIKLQS